MRLGCHWTLLLVLYIGVDFVDPSTPGVFFFDNDALFMDGVVQPRGEVVASPAHAESPQPVDRVSDVIESPDVSSKLIVFAPTRHGRRTQFLRDSPTSSARPSASEDH